MPEFMLNAEGQLVDKDGKVLEIEGEPVTVANAKGQAQIDAVVKERVARERAKLDELHKQIETLEAQAQKTPELEAMIRKLDGEKGKAESALADAEKNARDQVASQMSSLEKRAKQAEGALEAEQTARLTDQVTNTILGSCGDRFISPANDIVPRMLAAHKREPLIGDDGKPVDGQVRDVFQIAVQKDGKDTREWLTTDDALAALAAHPAFQHYVRAPSGGSGHGGKYTNVANLKRSAMSDEQKVSFVGEHGVEAFQKIPE